MRNYVRREQSAFFVLSVLVSYIRYLVFLPLIYVAFSYFNDSPPPPAAATAQVSVQCVTFGGDYQCPKLLVVANNFPDVLKAATRVKQLDPRIITYIFGEGDFHGASLAFRQITLAGAKYVTIQASSNDSVTASQTLDTGIRAFKAGVEASDSNELVAEKTVLSERREMLISQIDSVYVGQEIAEKSNPAYHQFLTRLLSRVEASLTKIDQAIVDFVVLDRLVLNDGSNGQRTFSRLLRLYFSGFFLLLGVVLFVCTLQKMYADLSVRERRLITLAIRGRRGLCRCIHKR